MNATDQQTPGTTADAQLDQAVHHQNAAPLNEFSEWFGKHLSSKLVLMSLSVFVVSMGLFAALLVTGSNQDLRQSANYTPQACTGSFQVSATSDQESITAYGKYWNFYADGSAWPTNGSNLQSVARYANGPCNGQAADTCTFDTRTFLTYNGARIESITAQGSYWNFNADGTLLNKGVLDSINRYASGPCFGQSAGACKFDTRTFVDINGAQVESITAQGSFWNFGMDGVLRDTGLLSSVNRYAWGPCSGQPSEACKFDSRAMFVANGQQVESIIVNGKFWNFNADGSGWATNGNDLTTVPRYANGPCAGKAAGTCVMDSRTAF